MMKTYLIPSLKIEEAQAAQMLAESLSVNTPDPSKPIDGGKALTKEDNAWDIWGDE